MDNTAQEKALSETKPKEDQGFILSGILYGPSEPGSTEDIALSGITILVKGDSKNTTSQSVISGGGGDFETNLIPPGKYKLIFSDPSGKYFHSDFTVKIHSDTDIPIYMTPSGEREKRKNHKETTGKGLQLWGRVKDTKNLSLADIEVSIKSKRIAPKSGFGKILASVRARIARANMKEQKKQEEDVALKVTTNILGFFYAGRSLPDGTYIVACYDQKGKYKFLSQNVIIKKRTYPFLSFTGYTLDVSEKKLPLSPRQLHDREEIEKALEKYKETTGKEVKMTEKTDRAAPQMTAEEATERLEQISSEAESKTHPPLYASPEKPAKTQRAGPRRIEDDKLSEHEKLWQAGKEEEQRLLTRLKQAQDLANQELRDNPEAWKRDAPPVKTVWVSPATEALKSRLRTNDGNQDESADQSAPEHERRKSTTPNMNVPSLGRGARASSQATKRAGKEMYNAVKSAINTIKKAPGSRMIMVVVLLIIGLIILAFLLFGPGAPAFPINLGGGGGSGGGNTGDGSTGGGSGNIAACMFYRGSYSPVAENYKSAALISYIETAANTSGVPASVLAGVARVETPTLTRYTDDTLSSYECPVSPDGAMGPMQIVVHYSNRTDAICRDCIAVGAGFLGKTVDELTQEDYCSLDSGFILGAGFILKKMQYLYGGDGTWNPAWTTDKEAIYALARSFYGCLDYPSCTDGPYNYGEDVWNSVSNCKPVGPGPGDATSCPIANGVLTCGSQMTPVDGPLGLCGHCGVGYNAPCNYEGTKFAIDIDGVAGDNVVLPLINGHNVKWTFFYEEPRGTGEAILGYGGEDTVTGDTYYLQLHHVAAGSQNRNEAYSGDSGARICSTCDHLHVQMGAGATGPNTTTWLDGAQFFCREPGV
jgi:hypothetical protein